MKYHSAQTYKAQRCTVEIGSIPLTVFRLPDGEYRLSQSEVSGVVEKPARSIFDFLRSTQLKSILDKGFEFSLSWEKVAVEGSQKPIVPISVEMALLYWYKWAQQGNQKALALVLALAKCSLYEAADRAIGVNRSQQEQQRTLVEDLSDEGVARLEAMQQDLDEQLGHLPQEPQALQELKLKVQLAQLELEQERLRLRREDNSYPAADIDKVGAAPWVVIPQLQKVLGWSDADATSKLLTQLGFGYRSKKWFKVKVTGDLWIMPHSTLDTLTKMVKQFKSQKQ